MGGGNYGGGNIVEEIEDSIRKLGDDLKDLKKYCESETLILRNNMMTKLSKDEGAELETRMTQYMEQVVNQIKTMFLEKEVITKRFNKIDRNIRTIKNEITAIRDKEEEEDTGMFTKRKLAQGVHCASCEKDIKNLLSGHAEHSNWNKLPFHKPNDNIARYGAGFSKILQQMKPSESEAALAEQHASAMLETQRS